MRCSTRTRGRRNTSCVTMCLAALAPHLSHAFSTSSFCGMELHMKGCTRTMQAASPIYNTKSKQRTRCAPVICRLPVACVITTLLHQFSSCYTSFLSVYYTSFSFCCTSFSLCCALFFLHSTHNTHCYPVFSVTPLNLSAEHIQHISTLLHLFSFCYTSFSFCCTSFSFSTEHTHITHNVQSS